MSLTEILKAHRPDLASYIPLYKHFHSHPELSFAESATAARIASELSSLCDGIYATNLKTSIGGHGLATHFSNGPGPTVLLRADIDGLPVEETTGLEWASKARQIDPTDGVDKPTMHACGHDIHITSLLAAADGLGKARESWSGTLVLVFQPAEERGAGAQAMVDDGLYSKGLIPVPDVCVGGHVMPMRAGALGTRRGLVACACDAMGITLHGTQGHSSQPHRTIDPILLAASTITRLHTIVSREIAPPTPAVLSVTSLHAGSAHNIIPSSAELKVNIRAWDDRTRTKLLSSIERVVAAECAASGAPRPAEYSTIATYPLTVNDESVTAALEKTFAAHFQEGKEGYDAQADMLGGSEDFGILATAVGKPSCFFTYGGFDHGVWDRAVSEGKVDELPINHSPYFAPKIEGTLDTAVDAYMLAALTFLDTEGR